MHWLDEQGEREFQERIGRVLNNYTKVMCTDDLMDTLRAEVRAAIDQMEADGLLPPDYVRWELFQTEEDPSTVELAAARNFARYPMDREEFIDRMGREPKQDDLERINCDQAGHPGHLLCGWDVRARKPRFELDARTCSSPGL